MERSKVMVCDPDILGGVPVFRGTRVPVNTLIEHLKAGDSLDDFLDGFPTVKREQAEVFLDLALEAAISQKSDASPAG